MKLLLITQKIDKNDDVLGFMHGWSAEFAKAYEKVTIIALKVGEYDLSENVKVLSLGKEEGKSRFKYVYRFYKYIFKFRKEYDSVLVHMNKEYVVLGGLFWKIYNKKINLWFNHNLGHFFGKVAGVIADNIFCTSSYSFFAKKKKTKLMPAGVDTDIFKREDAIAKKNNSLVSLGRISPIKRIDLLTDTLKILDKKNIKFILNIVGEAPERDSEYYSNLLKSTTRLQDKGKVKFLGSIPNCRVKNIYNENEIFLNMTDSGSYDKTIIEAMACENIILISNEAFKNIIPEKYHEFLFFKEGDREDLAEKILILLKMKNGLKDEIGRELREIAISRHSLSELVNKLIKNI